MHYEVTSALKPGQQLTGKQRTSPYFTDSPRIGVHTIRRGQVLRLSEAQFQASKADIRKLLRGEAIELYVVNGEFRDRILDFDVPLPAQKEAVETKETPDAPPPAPVVEAPVVDTPSAVEPAPESSVPAPAPEPVKDDTPQYSPPPAPPMPEKTYSTKKSKK